MVGAGWLHPNLGGLEFWNKFPVKYQTVRSYERLKVQYFNNSIFIQVHKSIFSTKPFTFLSRKVCRSTNFILRSGTSFVRRIKKTAAAVRSFNYWLLQAFSFYFVLLLRHLPMAYCCCCCCWRLFAFCFLNVFYLFLYLQRKGTPMKKIAVKGKKRGMEETQDEIAKPPKKAKTTPASLVHDVEIQEDVDDAIEDEIPPTQLPAPASKYSKKKETRGRASTQKQRLPAAAATKPPGAGKTAKPSKVNLTQKRKDNISASFLTALGNKGITEEMRRTKR